MDALRSFLGMGAGDSAPAPAPVYRGGNGKTFSERADALARAQAMQLAMKQDELEEVDAGIEAAKGARDRTALARLIARKRQLAREIQNLSGRLANVRVQSRTALTAEANLEQARLTAEAAQEIQYLNRQAESIDIDGAVDDLQEGVADTMEYSDRLAEPLDTGGFNLETVDEEIDRLMRNQEEAEATEAMRGAPSVPATPVRGPGGGGGPKGGGQKAAGVTE